jgi:succinyl-CoA synthetase beta subunit
MLFSDMGGIDIEEVAEEHPDHVGAAHFSTAPAVLGLPGQAGHRRRPASPAGAQRATPILARGWRELFSDYDMTLAEINPLAELEDGSFVALDAHMDMENEGGRARRSCSRSSASATRRRARRASRRPFEIAGEASTPPTTAA